MLENIFLGVFKSYFLNRDYFHSDAPMLYRHTFNKRFTSMNYVLYLNYKVKWRFVWQ